MNSFSLLAAFLISLIHSLSLNVLFCEAGLQVDLIDMDGLNYFKSNNLTNPGVAAPVIQNIKQRADGALTNNRSYSVINTTYSPPDGNNHSYYSWAPYFHPDCTGIKNVTDQMTQCPYVRKDGVYASDLNLLSDPNDSGRLVYDVTALSLYYYLSGDEKYAIKGIQLLETWFVNNDTAMAPNVVFGQVVRGPGQWTGRVEGILDMRFYAFIPAVADIFKSSKNWSQKMSDGMRSWFTRYSNWLATNPLGIGAQNGANNHGSFFVVQQATYLSWIGRTDKAIGVINNFISKQFQSQIIKSGEQPLESGRTRPFHYQYFNLVALTYIARLSEKIGGLDVWGAKTRQGATIKTAIDYLVSQGLPKNESPVDFLVPLYAAKQHYGDPTGSYSEYLGKLLKMDKASDDYWMLWSPSALSWGGSPPTNNSTNSTDDGDDWGGEDDGGGYVPSQNNSNMPVSKDSNGAENSFRRGVGGVCLFLWVSIVFVILEFVL